MAAQQSPKPNPTPTSEQIKRWRKYLAEERAEAHAYREIAKRREGKSRLILEELAAAERRHEEHWLRLLGPHAEPAPRTSLYARILQALAIRIGSVFILALMQRSEERGTYDLDGDATRQMAADEHLHSEVVRALAAKSRAQFSGKARAMVFGINDGLVSNLALIGGIVGAGSSHLLILLTGFSGLVAGALSMAAGEFISVTSQREILSSSLPDPNMTKRLGSLDRAENELRLLFMAQGEDLDSATAHAAAMMEQIEATNPKGLPALPAQTLPEPTPESTTETSTTSTTDSQDSKDNSTNYSLEALFDPTPGEDYDAVGSGWQAGAFSFISFSLGAFLPLVPFLLGIEGWLGITLAATLVAMALLVTGGTMGVLSGKAPLWRSIRQALIGLAAAAITYFLGEIASRVLS